MPSSPEQGRSFPVLPAKTIPEGQGQSPRNPPSRSPRASPASCRPRECLTRGSVRALVRFWAQTRWENSRFTRIVAPPKERVGSARARSAWGPSTCRRPSEDASDVCRPRPSRHADGVLHIARELLLDFRLRISAANRTSCAASSGAPRGGLAGCGPLGGEESHPRPHSAASSLRPGRRAAPSVSLHDARIPNGLRSEQLEDRRRSGRDGAVRVPAARRVFLRSAAPPLCGGWWVLPPIGPGRRGGGCLQRPSGRRAPGNAPAAAPRQGAAFSAPLPVAGHAYDVQSRRS